MELTESGHHPNQITWKQSTPGKCRDSQSTIVVVVAVAFSSVGRGWILDMDGSCHVSCHSLEVRTSLIRMTEAHQFDVNLRFTLMIEIYRVRVKIVFRPNFALITNTCTVATTTS